MKQCINCGKPLSNRQQKYCSTQCHSDYQYKIYIDKWKKDEKIGLHNKSLSNYVRRYMLEKANYSCEQCGWNKKNPITNKTPLEIHHIDGNYCNNTENNLQVLCPNCHSLTSNYKALNRATETRIRISNRKRYCADCGKEISPQAYYCRACANKRKITVKPLNREELKKAIREKPFTLIGKEQNVSDSAIRKWCKQYHLPTKKTQIKKYSDEEWEKI